MERWMHPVRIHSVADGRISNVGILASGSPNFMYMYRYGRDTTLLDNVHWKWGIIREVREAGTYGGQGWAAIYTPQATHKYGAAIAIAHIARVPRTVAMQLPNRQQATPKNTKMQQSMLDGGPLVP
ncbi:hypothetical protein DFH06DRAFT_1142289 [Mycena polygramma]|nr:hypothetical protein DFH06DRAFT_1142289 [Mycena polygramma]